MKTPPTYSELLEWHTASKKESKVWDAFISFIVFAVVLFIYKMFVLFATFGVVAVSEKMVFSDLANQWATLLFITGDYIVTIYLLVHLILALAYTFREDIPEWVEQLRIYITAGRKAIEEHNHPPVDNQQKPL